MNMSDDDKTVLRPHPGAGPGAGAPASAHVDSGNGLPPGTRLAEFELLREIGDGGFSIVYLAQDHSLDRWVALKEYMPSALAARAEHSQVFPKSARHRDTYDAGLRSFVNEAKLLARFDHPSLVKVYRFWEANGTAYMVMPFYQGITLKQWLARLPQPPGEAALRALLAPLTEALAVIHAEACYHRDIAPDNVILLAETGQPLLLDFGAARRVIGDMTQALTVILKPGFAPVEQYAETPGMKQGPWTDVYALAATVYFAITGRTPPPSVSRLIDDQCPRLVQLAAGRYSLPFLTAIDRALGVRPEERTPSVEALRADLGLAGAAAPGADRTVLHELLPASSQPPVPDARFGDVPGGSARPGAGRRDTAVGAAAGAVSPSGPTLARSSRRPALLAGSAVVALLVTGALAFFLSRPPSSPVPPAAPIEPRAPPALAEGGGGPPSEAPLPGTRPDTPPDNRLPARPTAPDAASPGGVVQGALPAPAGADGIASPAPSPPAVAAAPPLPAGPPDLRGEFDRVLTLQTPGFTVEAAPAAAELRIGRDRLGFEVTASRAGHVQVLVLGPDGSLTLLFPNTRSGRNYLRAGERLRLPQSSWPLETLPPVGEERFLVLVTAQPRDHAAMGIGREAWFTKLPTGAAAARMASRHPGLPSWLLGLAKGCDGAACDEFGAAQFSVRIVAR